MIVGIHLVTEIIGGPARVISAATIVQPVDQVGIVGKGLSSAEGKARKAVQSIVVILVVRTIVVLAMGIESSMCIS